MCNGEHRPLFPPRVVATVAFSAFESMPFGRASLLELRAGSCRDRFGEDVDYVELSGELDAFTASRIGEPLSGITRLAGDLVIDTRLVSFIDSAGLRLLEDMFDRGAANCGSVRLHDPSPVVNRLMRLAGVEGTLATCTTGQTGDEDRRAPSISGCPPQPGAVGDESHHLDSSPTRLARRALLLGARQRHTAMTTPDERHRQILELLHTAHGGPVETGRLCEVSRDVTAMTGAGIMLIVNDVTRGSICVSNDVSDLIEELQYTLGEGPCIDAYHQRQVVTEPDLTVPVVTRWQAFTPPAVAAGVRAVFGFPITVGTVRLGALNLYRDQPGPLTVMQHSDALLLADAAARLIIDMQADAAPGAIGPGLVASGNFRFVVHQASGMVAAQLAINVDDAMLRLRAYAFVHGRGVSDVAADVVARQLRFDTGDEQ